MTKGEEQNETASPETANVAATFRSPSTGHLQWPPRMGRDEECEVIVSSVLRVMQTATPEIVWVHGSSGTGKSAAIQMCYNDLARTKIHKDSKRSGIAWVSGKYDEQFDGARPFSAILDAVTELYSRLHHTAIRQIREEFTSDELSLLSAVIPFPSSVIDSQKEDDYDNIAAVPDLDDQLTTENDANQFRTFIRLFRRMLTLICKHYACVVVVLDDVQWCDDASRELLENILSDTFCSQLSNFCFVLVQRTGSDEPEFKVPETNLSITKLEMKAMQYGKINEVVAFALNMKPSATMELTELVQRRTAGNTLFVVQFVEDLCTKRFVAVSNGSDGQYEWDLQAIATKTQSTANVADILIQKLQTLPFEIQLALVIAAHLGFRFDGKVLAEILQDTVLFNLFSQKKEHALSLRMYMTSLFSGLDQATKMGLIEQLDGTDKFRFVHDRVQKSAASLLPSGQKGEKILAKLGEMLLERIEAKKGEAWMIFSATNLLTKHNYSLDSRISGKRIATLHHKAAKIARKQSAYWKAATFAETGAEKLGQHAWTQDYRLGLTLHCIAAEMYFAAGNMESSMAMVTKIEENASCVKHCFRAYNVLAAILGARGDYEGSVTQCRKRLEHLGVALPRRPGQSSVLTNLIKTKVMLRGRSAKDLENLSAMKDVKKMQAVRMLGHVGEAYFNLGDGDGCACACLVMLQVVLKYGLCSEGVYAFPAYAICLGHLGDIKECAAFFDLGRKLSEKDDMALAITSAASHRLGHFLSHEFSSSPYDLMKASEASVRLGDIYRAGFNLRDVCPIGVFAGFRLKELEERVDYCVEFFKDYNQNASWESMLPWLQFPECIRGQTDDIKTLSGKFIQKEIILEQAKDPSKLDTRNRAVVLGWHYCQNFLLLLHNEHEKILEEQKKFKHIQEEMGPNWPKIINCFNCALSNYSLIQSKKATWRGARKYSRIVKKHSVANSPMLKTMLVVIQAEEAAVRNKREKAFDLYEQAAVEFERQSLYLYKALTLERAARFAMAMGDKKIGLRLFKDSYDEYELYGAEAKTHIMRQELEEFQTT